MSNPSRREVLRATVGTVVSAIAATGREARAQTPARPNILWLVSEDNNPYLGCYGDRLAHTPNIDALARRGLLFRHVFSAASVCALSRFGILTGVHPEACAPANQMRATATLPPEIRTYPEYLREAGYYCTNNSKTDFNCDADASKLFDESSATAHYNTGPAGKPFFAIFNFNASHEQVLIGHPGTGRGGTVPAGAVTPDQVVVPAYLPDTPDVRSDFARYYNAATRADAEIGNRIGELEAAGLADDTIIFYYSDNGGVLPRSKRYCYNEGLCCAMVVVFPPKWAHLAPARMGTEIQTPVMLLDLAPTLLSLLNTPAESRERAAHAELLRTMRTALNEHMLAIVDNGFIPEGMPQEGYRNSRDGAAYPLARLMELGAKACARDRANVGSFTRLLTDENSIIRHWAAQGLLMLGRGAAPARAPLERMMRSDALSQNRVVAAEAIATIAPSPEAVSILARLVDASDPCR